MLLSFVRLDQTADSEAASSVVHSTFETPEPEASEVITFNDTCCDLYQLFESMSVDAVVIFGAAASSLSLTLSNFGFTVSTVTLRLIWVVLPARSVALIVITWFPSASSLSPEPKLISWLRDMLLSSPLSGISSHFEEAFMLSVISTFESP